MPPFIGRKAELAELRQALQRTTATVLLVHGRRRLGKSRLVEEFARPYRFLELIGEPPHPESTREDELDAFAGQLSRAARVPRMTYRSWGDAFGQLARATAEGHPGRVIILLDEIAWMGSKDPAFVAELKKAWETAFRKNNGLILVLCGESSSWMQTHLLSPAGLKGTITRTVRLEELPLDECGQFWNRRAGRICGFEKATLLAATGGVPRYLEQIDPRLPAEQNIERLCFTHGPQLTWDFDSLFSTYLLPNSPKYTPLLRALMAGPKDPEEIGRHRPARQVAGISGTLEELAVLGYLQREHRWDLDSGPDPRHARYRLSANYLRFYLQYIERRRQRIDQNLCRWLRLWDLPGWQRFMGTQLKNLVVNSRRALYGALQLDARSVVHASPYLQCATAQQPGCAIDLLIQTNPACLYVCEIRCTSRPIGVEVIQEVQRKIEGLKGASHFDCKPVLIHISGVTGPVAHSGYFAHIVDTDLWLR